MTRPLLAKTAAARDSLHDSEFDHSLRRESPFMKVFSDALAKFLVLLVMCGIAQPALSQETKRIRFAVTNPPHFLPIWLAKDAGIFSKHGLDVEVIFMRGGSLITVGI